MNAFEAALGPRLFGAEILSYIARERLSGTLTFGPPRKRQQIMFHGGRPQAACDAAGRQQTERPEVVAAVRTFAAASTGRCLFDGQTSVVQNSHNIDTLGESLMAVLKTVTAAQLDAFWAARGGYSAKAGPLFDRFATAIEGLIDARFAIPPPGATVEFLVAGLEPQAQRGWAAMIALGAVETNAPPMKLSPPAAPIPEGPQAVPVAANPAAQGDASALSQELREAHARLDTVDHYTVLGVPHDAQPDAIRKAYFALAKRWHTDRLASLGLDAEVLKLAEDLFRRADEAHQTLCDAEKRSAYDWVLDRKAKGLPTDAAVIMEAEDLFRRAEGLVRRGQAKGAEPLLRQAVELNPGEAEFFAYLGYAVYAARGRDALAEAHEDLNKALDMQENLDVAYEFLGRIAHVEGRTEEARKYLEKAVARNSNNKDAQRELRLLVMREQEKEAPSKGGKTGGLFGKLLKR